MADVRVSFHDGRGRVVAEKDGLQKVHRVAPNMAVAFAGGVEAGLFCIEDFARMITSPGYIRSPARTAWWWQRRLRNVWRRVPSAARRGGLELLLVGAFPQPIPMFSFSDTYLFRAPDFNLERLARGTAWSIGSGSAVPYLVSELESYKDDWPQLAQFSLQPFPGGPGGPIAATLGQLIRDKPVPGVSSSLIFSLVAWTKTTLTVLESPDPALTTPPLVSTLSDFRDWAKEALRTGAVATANR